MRTILAAMAVAVLAIPALAQDFHVDPTFLHRHLPDIAVGKAGLSSATAAWRPVFGEGDANSGILKGVSRFGELSVAAGGASTAMRYPREENVIVIREGEGSILYDGKANPVKADDFVYIPPGVEFSVRAGPRPLKAVITGFRIPEGTQIKLPAAMPVANISEVQLTEVAGHPNSARYRLLMGDTASKRDRLAVAHTMVSLYLLELAPGGTNAPHHHELQEEIYLLLDGSGEMVAGSGMNGIEGRYPAKPGDAYFYRANATVGFYNAKDRPARILALRNTAPLGIGLRDR
ncbi:MAG TPA: cupin domain-containing protein [Rhizomicrobium sp.]|nr:cupin domain-containing protein [Rhizomicrobium sp.]